MTRATVEIKQDKVVKHRDRDGAAHEARASEYGRRIGEACGLFQVPRVLGQTNDRRGDQGTIEFERIKNNCNIRKALSDGCLPADAMATLGACLAAIHKTPPADDTCAISSVFLAGQSAQPEIFLHGDFQIENIFYDPQAKTLHIIDWSAPKWLGDHGNLGPAFIDLGCFILSLFIGRPFERGRVNAPAVPGTLFLKGYVQGGGDKGALEGLKDGFPALLSAFRSRPGARSQIQVAVRAASLARAARYVKNLDVETLDAGNLNVENGA